MNFDDKLNAWREATDALEPSDALLAKLQAVTQAPTPPAGPAAAIGTAVKVLIVTVLVGVFGGYAMLRLNEVGLGWSTRSQPVRADAGRGSAAAPSEPARVDCGPQALALVAGPKDPGGPHSDKQLRLQLTTRPLTCLAQRHPIEQLLVGRSAGAGDAEATRLLTRLTLLCGPSNVSGYMLPWDQSPCDDSDWCTRTQCELTTEACATSWAAHPASTCTHRMGVRRALVFACARSLRGGSTDSPVRALASDAWCLNPEALKERDLLRTLDAGMELQ